MLRLELLEDRLDDPVARREVCLVGRSRDERAKAIGLIRGDPALGHQFVDLAVDPGHALIDARLVKIRDDHGNLKATDEEQGELPGHEAGTNHADLGDGLCQVFVGGTGGALGALLHEVKRVDACAELVTGDQIGECLVLGGKSGLLVGVLGRLEELECTVGRLRDATNPVGEHLLGDADGDVPLCNALDLAGLVLALNLDAPGDHPIRPTNRILEEVCGLEYRVGNTQFKRLGTLEHSVVLERVLDNHLEGVLDSDQVGQKPCSTPAGDDPEEHLRQRKRRHGTVDSPVIRVERNLDATAQS